MADPYDLTEAIRAAILALEETHSRGKLAEMAGVSKTVMSDFLNERDKQPQIGADKVSSLARSLKLPIVNLFNRAKESKPLPRPVTLVRSTSSSIPVPGDADGTQARILRENARLAEDNAALRAAIKDAGKQLIKLAAMGKKTRRAQGTKLSVGGRD